MALSKCKTCERLVPPGLLTVRGQCRKCNIVTNILLAQATRTKYARLGFKKYDGRCNKTGKHARKRAEGRKAA